MTDFEKKVAALRAHHEELLSRKNEPIEWGNGIYEKYKNPVVTAAHVPLEWKYDFNEQDNPYLMQRIMCNATLNAGAIKWNGKYVLVVRVEGAERMAGSMVCSVRSVTTIRNPAISLRQRLQLLSPARKTSRPGSACPT